MKKKVFLESLTVLYYAINALLGIAVGFLWCFLLNKDLWIYLYYPLFLSLLLAFSFVIFRFYKINESNKKNMENNKNKSVELEKFNSDISNEVNESIPTNTINKKIELENPNNSISNDINNKGQIKSENINLNALSALQNNITNKGIDKSLSEKEEVGVNDSEEKATEEKIHLLEHPSLVLKEPVRANFNVVPVLEFPARENIECNYELNKESLLSVLDKDIEELTHWLKSGECKNDLAFSYDGKSNILIVENTKDINNNIYFLSDVHGDILALDIALKHIDSIDKDSYIVFMGDLFDRGNWGMEVVVRVLQLIKSRKNKIMWVAGNHDLALGYSADTQTFTTSVIPAEFYSYLNKNPQFKEFGISLIDFIEILPRAIFFDNGLVCTHGGVPHNDITPDIKTKEDLSKPEMLQDFTWIRLSNSIKKRPNRKSKSCDIGKKDVDEFCNIASDVLGFDLKYIILGHQHPSKGFLQLGINTKCLIIYSSFNSEVYDFTVPSIARFQLADAPIPISLNLDNIKDVYTGLTKPLEETILEGTSLEDKTEDS